MRLIALASVKGSPGVTTCALALAAAWPGRRLVIETDPSGGDLGAWLALPPAPGLTGLAAAARRSPAPGAAWEHAQDLGSGLHAAVAPAGAEQAAACLATLAGTWETVLTPGDGEPAAVIADCGRLDPGSAALALAAQAETTLVMVRPQVSDLAHLALRADALARAGVRPVLLLAPGTGRGPAEAGYLAGEITATLGLPVQASIPADPRGAAALAGHRGELARLGRLPLARAAASLAAALTGGPSQPPTPAEPGPPTPVTAASSGGECR